MSAPIGNKFWELRSKHGRDKIFEDPEILKEEAYKYFTWCVENPLIEIQFHGKDAQECEVPKMRAFTWDGLETFLGVESLREYKTNPSYKDFSQVITHIEKIIYTQKFTGAAAGFLNANIIARDLGLTDRKDLTTDGEKLSGNTILWGGKEIKV